MDDKSWVTSLKYSFGYEAEKKCETLLNSRSENELLHSDVKTNCGNENNPNNNWRNDCLEYNQSVYSLCFLPVDNLNSVSSNKSSNAGNFTLNMDSVSSLL